LSNAFTLNRASSAWTIDPRDEIKKVADGEPRVYRGEQRLLVEDQRDSILLGSANTDASAWSASIGTDIENYPDDKKNQTVQKIDENTDSQYHFIRDYLSGSPQTLSCSHIVKAAGRDEMVISQEAAGSQIQQAFDLNDGTAGQSSPSSRVLAAKAVSIGNGWYNARVVFDIQGDSLGEHRVRLFKGWNNRDYTGENGKGILWMLGDAQPGSYVSSPILEGSTRNKDTVYISGLDDLTNDVVGTWLMDLKFLNDYSPSTYGKIFTFGGISNSVDQTIQTDGQSSEPYGIRFGGTSYQEIDHFKFVNSNQRVRVAVSANMQSNELILSVNGESRKSTSYNKGAGIPRANSFFVGQPGYVDHQLAIKSIGYDPSYLTKSEIDNLTTVI